jgi:hypothetical protein
MGVVDNSIGDATNKGPHPSVTSAPHHHEPCLDLVRQPDDCCVRPPQHEVRLQSLRSLARMRSTCPSNHERGVSLGPLEASFQTLPWTRCGTQRSVCIVSIYTLGGAPRGSGVSEPSAGGDDENGYGEQQGMSCTTRSFT